jgi:hypothetical protein
MKILPMGVGVVRFRLAVRQTDRQTEVPKLKVAFRNFSYVPKNCPFVFFFKASVLRGVPHPVFYPGRTAGSFFCIESARTYD